MARVVERLTKADVKGHRQKGTGYHPDGQGLYLRVAASGARMWAFIYSSGEKTAKGHPRSREIGLGSAYDLPLDLARLAAQELRQKIRQGIDPIAERRHERALKQASKAQERTFREVAEDHIAAHVTGKLSDKAASQWPNTLRDYAYQKIGDLRVDLIEVPHIVDVLRPIWTTKAETAKRVRQRIEAVLTTATAMGLRPKNEFNPARLEGPLGQILGKQGSGRGGAIVREHHAAMSYREVGAFMGKLRQQQGVGARALEFCILTLARTNEVIGAKWEEIDLDKKIWTVPAERMKNGKDHRVTLSVGAIGILEAMAGDHQVEPSAYVFPGRGGATMSNAGMASVLKRMNVSNATVHGFRATFRTWVADETHHPEAIAEMALSHTVSDDVIKAYNRAELLEKRAKLTSDWNTFCSMAQPAKGKRAPSKPD